MHHPHSTHQPITRHHSAAPSPLAAVEQSFLALAHDAQPLTLPAHLISDEPEQAVLPVDQIRSRLAHPSARPDLRIRTWSEVVRRAQTLGEPWTVVAVAMAIPALRRMLARLGRPAYLERNEVEQEALAALTIALYSVDAAKAGLDRELFRAADSAAHRLAYAARRRVQREDGEAAVHLGRLQTPSTVGESEAGVDEHTVLARAVRAEVLDVSDARLIARTRLNGELMQCLAAERGVSVRQLYRHRATAERILVAHLNQQLRDQ
ncbi:hypothetical protein [Streptomyces sp. NPDC042319]|uniref:hypothetical protein n=1 Tax=Streptomyces sp. NPDC042319 TaxID=3154332 RepID=UPI0033D0029C